MQHYGQETVTVMTAYSAVFLVKVWIEKKSIVILWFKKAISASQLLQSPNTADEFSSDTMNEIHGLITQTADAYQEASSSSSPVSISTAYHSRFLRHLVHKDIFKVRKSKRERHVGVPIDPRLQGMKVIMVIHVIHRL